MSFLSTLLNNASSFLQSYEAAIHLKLFIVLTLICLTSDNCVAFNDSPFPWQVPATREVLGSLPNVFSALCLNARGLQSFVQCQPFERLFKVLLSPDYLPAMRRRRSSDPLGKCLPGTDHLIWTMGLFFETYFINFWKVYDLISATLSLVVFSSIIFFLVYT